MSIPFLAQLPLGLFLPSMGMPELIVVLGIAVLLFGGRKIPEVARYAQYSGLEPLTIRPESNFIMIGERTNVTGSKRFSNLIKKNDYNGALEVALDQVRSGANPLTDVLSFLAAARPGALKNAGRFSTAVCAVGERMREIHPQHPWPYAVVAALTLAWLIERVLQHCLEDECGDAGNVAIRSHWRLIPARNAWLAPL